MKLLASFKSQLGKMGPLKRVWFTSFNFSPEFLETYLLSAVLEMEVPKNRLDYEHMQITLSEKKIDFRVFCDKRFMDAGQNKRTAIPVHAITPTQMGGFSKESLFHPKVIYLEDTDGQMIIGSGSANLTLSGWGRNQEVFQFFKITALDQYRSARLFFESLFVSAGLELPLGIRRGFEDESPRWRFVHSFQNDSFLKQLFRERESDHLLVWSPYFPRDLASFVGELKSCTKIENLKVSLVPDLVDGKYVRTQFSEKLMGMIANGEVSFYRAPVQKDENIDMCHAKVWKLDNRLAIGSWNFTRPGANCLLDDNNARSEGNNVEAGFILEDSSPWQDGVGKPIEMSASDFATTDLLNEESLDIPEELPFDIRVHFDWRDQHYHLSGEWISEGLVDEKYWLKVPDLSQPIQLTWRPGKRELQIESRTVARPNELLTERRFEIRDAGKKLIFQGLITESGLDCRRGQEYESLRELIDAFVFDSVDGEDTPYSFRIHGDENSDYIEDEDDFSQPPPDASDSNISYFRLFQAAKQYADKIKAVKNVTELNKRVFTRPGCLVELIDKTKDKFEGSEPSIFNWFLAQEVNALCRVAKEQLRKLGIHKESLPKERWNALKVSSPSLPKGIEKGYVELIKKECRYAGR